MGIRGFSANTETLLFLAWAASVGLQKLMREAQDQRLPDETRQRMLCERISSSSIFECDGYGSVYKVLFEYRLSLVDLQDVQWALQGYNAVYLKDMAGEDEDYARSCTVTDLFWRFITYHEHLLCTLLGILDSDQDYASVLQEHFVSHLRTMQYPFLISEFILMSLECVDWMILSLRLQTMALSQEGSC